MANLPITHHKLGPPIRIQATKIQEPPQPSVEIEVQVPKDVASMFVQEELNVEPKKQADEKKVLLENEKEDTKLDEADKIDTMTFYSQH